MFYAIQTSGYNMKMSQRSLILYEAVFVPSYIVTHYNVCIVMCVEQYLLNSGLISRKGEISRLSWILLHPQYLKQEILNLLHINFI